MPPGQVRCQVFGFSGAHAHVRLQVAGDFAWAGRLWAGNAIASLVQGSLGILRLAHAEAAAQAASSLTATAAEQPNPRKPHETRALAANILRGAAQGLTPLVTRTLTKRGLIGPLLQVRAHDHKGSITAPLP
jgi:hypothetical protein